MTDETKRGAKKSNKIKIRLKSSIFGRILISFASALRFLKRKSNLSLRYFSDSKNIHGFNHSISGYVMILIVMAVPVLLFGAKYVLDQRTLSDQNTTLGSGKLVKQCAGKAAKAVAEKWNPALTYAQQREAMLRIADEIYNNSNAYLDSPMVRAVHGINTPRKVKGKVGAYSPIKETESTESLQTEFEPGKKTVARTGQSTDMKRYHFYYYYKTNHAPMAVKHFDIMYASLKRSNANLFPPDEDLYQDYVYYCENTTDPLGKEVGWYHYVTWPEVVGMSSSDGTPENVEPKSYTTRTDLDDKTVKIEIEGDKIKVTTDDDVAYAVPAKCNVDIILTVPTNSAALNQNNNDKNTSTSGTPYISESTTPTDDAKETPICEITRAYQEFLKENFFYTRGVNVGVIPYSGKVSLRSDRSDWVKAPDKFVDDGSTNVVGAVLYGTKGENGEKLTEIGSFAGGDVSYGLLCRGNTENYGSNKITKGDLLLSTENPTTSDSYKFRKMVYDPCYLTDANLLSMKCENGGNKYWMNPYFILEMNPDVKFIYNMLGAFYPYYDDRNVSNFIFIPVTWANNLLQSWSATGGNSAQNTSANSTTLGRLSTPSKGTKDDGRKKVLILIVNKPDWFEPGELTYLGFDNDYSETLAVESDLIRFDKGKTSGAKGILEYDSSKGNLSFPRKGLLRIVVEPTSGTGTIKFTNVSESYPSATSETSVKKRTEFFITPDKINNTTDNNNYYVGITLKSTKLVSAEITNRPYKVESGKVVYTALTPPERSVFIDLLKQSSGGKFDYEISGADNSVTPSSHLVYGSDGDGNISDVGIKYQSPTYTPTAQTASNSSPSVINPDASENPENWKTTTVELPSVVNPPAALNSICYGNGKFIAVGGTSNVAAYSEDGGDNWNMVQLLETPEYWSSVCYNPKDELFYAIAKGSSTVAYSQDGKKWYDFREYSCSGGSNNSGRFYPNINFPSKNWTSIGNTSNAYDQSPYTVALAEGDNKVAVFYRDSEFTALRYAELEISTDYGNCKAVGRADNDVGSILCSKGIYTPRWKHNGEGISVEANNNSSYRGSLPENVNFTTLCENAIFDTNGFVYMGIYDEKNKRNYTKFSPCQPQTKIVSADFGYDEKYYVGVGNTREGDAVSAIGYYEDEEWKWKSPPAIDSVDKPQMTSVCYGDGKFFAVAKNSSNIYWHVPGAEKWEKKSLLPPEPKLKSVCCGKVDDEPRFVAVISDSSKVVYSEDGENWTEADMPVLAKWSHVCYGDGKFVAISDEFIAYSPYGDGSWKLVEEPIKKNYDTWYELKNWKSICYGNGKFLAISGVTYQKSRLVAEGKTDEDGILKWTATAKPDSDSFCYGDGKFVAVPNKNYESVCYGNGKFFAVGDKCAAYSTDGINWTSVTTEQFSSVNWKSVCYGNGKFVAVAENCVAYFDSSNNAVGAVELTGNWESICYCGELGRFVAVDDSGKVAYCDVKVSAKYVTAGGENKIARSSNGINWYEVDTLPSYGIWQSVCYGNGKFVVVGGGSAPSDVSIAAAYSTDGINWKDSGLWTDVRWQSVCYGNGKFVAVGMALTSGLTRIFAYSDDGINWNYDEENSISEGSWKSVCYGNGKFVAVGDKCAAYSTDGNSWASVTGEFSSKSWRSVCYGKGKFVAVGPEMAAYSTDGKNWTVIDSTQSSDISKYRWNSVCYGNGKFVAVAEWDDGDNKAVKKAVYSSDGVDWTKTDDITNNKKRYKWGSVCYGDGKFVAVTLDSDKVVYSSDGKTWTETTLPFSGNWTSVVAVREEEPEIYPIERGWYFYNNDKSDSTNHHFIFKKNPGDMYFVTNSEEFTYKNGDIYPMKEANGFFIDVDNTYFEVNGGAVTKYLGSGLYRWTMPAEKAKGISISSNANARQFYWSVKNLGDVSLPTLYAGATLPINAALFTGGWQSKDGKWNGVDATAAVKVVTQDACTKLKTEWGDNLRIYLIKYRAQAGDYSYLDDCASYTYDDVSDESGLKTKLTEIAKDITAWATRTEAKNTY